MAQTGKFGNCVPEIIKFNSKYIEDIKNYTPHGREGGGGGSCLLQVEYAKI